MKVVEFLVESPPSDPHSFQPKPIDFVVAPDSLRNLKPKDQVPRFKVTGKLGRWRDHACFSASSFSMLSEYIFPHCPPILLTINRLSRQQYLPNQ